jgi:hypothetical protein
MTTRNNKVHPCAMLREGPLSMLGTTFSRTTSHMPGAASTQIENRKSKIENSPPTAQTTRATEKERAQ